jgi:hypothetical protein
MGPLAGNQTVDILGSGFYGAVTMVRIHDVLASSMTLVSNSRIRAVTGARASAGNGTVTVTLSTSGTGSGGNYTYNPLPVLSAVAPSTGRRSGGTVVTITGSSLGQRDITSVLFGTLAAPASTWVSETRVLAATPTSSTSTLVFVGLTSTLFGSASPRALFTYNPGTDRH